MEPKVSFITAADLGRETISGRSLSSQVAAVLVRKIREGSFAPGDRLPTESAMAQHFGVSRTVIREAMSSLKAGGLVETRQGSRALVRKPERDLAFDIDPATRASIGKLFALLEVRRGIDQEVAALAAQRRDGSHLERLKQALRRMAEDDENGGDGVESDVQFHIVLAQATGNPYWVKLVEQFFQQIHAMIKVTRANNARSEDFLSATREEHQRIFDAVSGGDPEAARASAAEHMDRAAARMTAADRDFWAREGGEYSRRLIGDDPGRRPPRS